MITQDLPEGDDFTLMQTKSIILQTLCVPCGCHCRYCLLSWDNRPVGADYERSKRYAADFYRYIREKRPEIQFDFAFGYCMEHPDLPGALDFLNEIGSVQGEFLQMDGMKFRGQEESDRLIEDLISHGVKGVNFTFYGPEAYHDRFAAREGDFSHLLTLAKSALAGGPTSGPATAPASGPATAPASGPATAPADGLEVSAGIPVTAENTNQIEELIDLLESQGIQQISLFVPHEEGRGRSLASVRFSEADFPKLGVKGAAKLNRQIFRPEREWVRGSWPEEENRTLLISLTPENIEEFERMSFEAAIRSVEKLDEEYYAAIPSFQELCRLYGNPAGTGYYKKRDLYHHYQKLFIAEHGLQIYDVTDERFCGSIRY